MTDHHHVSDERFVWIDMETTDLKPQRGVPLEIGFTITDLKLEPMVHKSWMIYQSGWDRDGRYSQEQVDPLVWDMHVKSGLWDEIVTDGISIVSAQQEVEAFLEEWEVECEGGNKGDPMSGSSVQFDREWMECWFPRSFTRFSYRNIDVSTVKELMKRYSPDIYLLQDRGFQPTTKRGLHRVTPDLEDTISEFAFYRKEFLYVPTDFDF